VKKRGKDLSELKSEHSEFNEMIAMQKIVNFLNSDNKPKTGFKIPETPQRDLLVYKMAQKEEDRRKREIKEKHKKKEAALEMLRGTPNRPLSSIRDKYNSLSNAAKRLASSVHQKSILRSKNIGKPSQTLSSKITPKSSKK
jgi:hypothetical protein